MNCKYRENIATIPLILHQTHREQDPTSSLDGGIYLWALLLHTKVYVPDRLNPGRGEHTYYLWPIALGNIGSKQSTVGVFRAYMLEW